VADAGSVALVRRGGFGRLTKMIERLLIPDSFQLPADAEHYADGLRRAGCE
jgi:hypothetical protein